MGAAAVDHVAAANKYARDVLAGRIPACKWVKKSCQRHLDDLKASKSRAFPYRFDADAAAAVCQFGELLPHVKGRWARKKELIKLQPWQCFILCNLFGWVHKRSGLRKYRKAYIKVPRKNGKSVLAAIIALWMFAMDGEPGAEVYSGATTEKQAWEVFRPAKAMIQRSPDLAEAAGIEVWAKSLARPDDGSRFEPLIGKPGDGASPSCAIVDEYHEHDTPDLFDTMETGMGAREQPLLVVITTAGNNIAGPCFDQEKEAEQVLDGVHDMPELFALMYGIDADDNWADPAILEKANPNFGVSVDADYLRAQQRQATQNPAKQNRFKTKHLDVWCSAKTAWMNLVWWDACADPLLSLDEFEGKPCWVIVDLASKIDIAVVMLLFRERKGKHDHYYLFGRYYLPEETIETAEQNGQAYRKWVKQGLLIPTDGAEVDFDEIREDIKQLASRFQVLDVAYDPWRATQLAHQIAADGAKVIEYRQNIQNMCGPMREFEAAVKAMRMHHDGGPVLTWMVSNVVAKADRKDNLYPEKEKEHLKIDGAVAALMGLGRAMANEPEDGSYLNDSEVLMI